VPEKLPGRSAKDFMADLLSIETLFDHWFCEYSGCIVGKSGIDNSSRALLVTPLSNGRCVHFEVLADARSV